MTNSYRTSISGILFGLLAIPLVLPAPAQAISPSSYQSSCRNIKISDGDLLSAACRTTSGGYRISSVRIQGIQNKDGQLNFTRLNVASSYKLTCKSIGVAGATLTASCKKINDTYVNTSILIPGIKNINGDLSY